MLPLPAFVAIISTIPTMLAAPIGSSAISVDPYNCGYVRTRPNSSVVAGIFALDKCEPFFYNETISNYQEAFAYMLYGGCACRFYADMEDCSTNTSVPEYTGSTDRWREPLFVEPKPTWYSCRASP